MAKRKKRSGKGRRKVGSIGKLNLQATAMNVAYLGVGSIVAKVLTEKVISKVLETAKVSPDLAPKVSAVATIVAGTLLPKFIKGKVGEGVGQGVVAVGTFKLVDSLGIMNGIGLGGDETFLIAAPKRDDMSVIAGDDEYAMAGLDDVSVIAGFDEE